MEFSGHVIKNINLLVVIMNEFMYVPPKALQVRNFLKFRYTRTLKLIIITIDNYIYSSYFSQISLYQSLNM